MQICKFQSLIACIDVSFMYPIKVRLIESTTIESTPNNFLGYKNLVSLLHTRINFAGYVQSDSFLALQGEASESCKCLPTHKTRGNSKSCLAVISHNGDFFEIAIPKFGYGFKKPKLRDRSLLCALIDY